MRWPVTHLSIWLRNELRSSEAEKYLRCEARNTAASERAGKDVQAARDRVANAAAISRRLAPIASSP
jgi:hypothetical protein